MPALTSTVNPTSPTPSTPVVALTPNQIASQSNPNSLTYSGAPIATTGKDINTGVPYTNYNSPIATQSTTTLTSDKTADIKNNQNTTTALAQGGVTTNPDTGIATSANGAAFTPYTPAAPVPISKSGTTDTGGYSGETYYAPGSQVPTGSDGKPLTLTASSPSQDSILKSLNDQKAQSDALTAQMVANVTAQYEALQRQQEQVNAGANAATQGALFRSGAAQGDAYAQNAQRYQIQQGVNALADLATKKQFAILAAQQAGQAQNSKLQESINNEIASIAKDQAAAGQKLSDQILSAQQKTQESQAQVQKDTAISDIYTHGVTDIPGILSSLKRAGYTDITSDDISKTLTNIAKNNGIDTTSLDSISKEYFALSKLPNGLPASIKNLPDVASQLAAFIQMYNQASQSGKTLGTQATLPTSGAGSGALAVASSAGVTDTTVPLSQAITTVGIDKIVNGIIQNEGGSIKGVQNNPGNIKYAGLPGQIDSGVQAKDGGTFANYATPEEGRNAIKGIVQNAADGKSKAYGANPTFEQFMNTYTNTAPSGTAPGTTGNPQINASAPGYTSTPLDSAGGLTQAAIDKAAISYATTGTMPSVGLGSTGAAAKKRDAIQNRAAELDSSGTISANKARLSALTTSLGQQTTYQNTIERSVNTVDSNLKLLEDAANKVNDSSSPLINNWENQVKGKLIGSGDLASYKAAIQTVRSEYANILARGGQVTDSTRSEAANLIPDNITKSQLDSVLATLRAEGKNVLDAANGQVDSVQGQINNIIGGGNLYTVSGDNHGGIILPTDDSSDIELPH